MTAVAVGAGSLIPTPSRGFQSIGDSKEILENLKTHCKEDHETLGLALSSMAESMATLLRFIKGFGSAALIALASLSLAACGSGGGESTDPARKSALDARKKQLVSRETAVSRKEAQQKRKDEQQAAKDKELNNRPPRVVTRTVTRTPVDQFAGFSTTETVNIANMVKDAQEKRMPYSSKPWPIVSGSGNRPWYQSNQDEPAQLPDIIPALQGRKVIYNFNWHKNIRFVNASSYGRYFGRLLTAYPIGFTFNQNSYTATPLDLGLGDKFDSQILKAEVDTSGNNGAKDAKMHVEIVSDYSSENTTDWLAYGLWIQVPRVQTIEYSDYRVGTFALQSSTYGSIPVQLTGTATYKGSLLGLHTSIKNNDVKLSRLTGKATVNFDFGDAITRRGKYTLTFNEFKLNGQSVSGEISLTDIGLTNFPLSARAFSPATAIINGSNYTGLLVGTFTGPQTTNTTAPTGFTGNLRGASSDGNKSFIASFGAKKTE